MPAGKRWWLSPAAAYSGLAGNTSVTCLPVADVNPQVYPVAERQGELTGCDGRSAGRLPDSGCGPGRLPPAMDSSCYHRLYPPWTGP